MNTRTIVAAALAWLLATLIGVVLMWSAGDPNRAARASRDGATDRDAMAQVAGTPMAPPPPASVANAAAPPAARPPSVRARTRSAPTRVRVVIRLDGGAEDSVTPEPELLRLDADGTVSPMGRTLASRRHPALAATTPAAARPTEIDRTFEVTQPGRYAAAWHAWSRVPGTRTWRTRRGRGPELLVAAGDGDREVIVHVSAGDLLLPPSIDTRPPGASYHFTEKDGD